MKVIRSYLVIKTGLKLFIYLVLFFERHCGLQSLPVGGANAPKLTRGRRGRRSPGWVRGRCVCASTSGNGVCCSSLCFRDVQGLNGFNSRVCMSLPIPAITRLLPPPNEGNVRSHFVSVLLPPSPCSPGFNLALKSARIRAKCSPPQSASVAARGARASQPLAKQIQRRARRALQV